VDYLLDKIRSGGAGVWGAIPMPPQTIAEGEARSIANWLATGAAR
jgi:cytochrome c551/c552